MTLPEAIGREVAHLRRYARAVVGDAALGDRSVERMIETLLAEPPASTARTQLFKALDEVLAKIPLRPDTEMALNSPPAQRAILLTNVENFTREEAASILGVSEVDFDNLILAAEDGQVSLRNSRIFIIEDEPLIAASLSRLVESLGHSVIGIAVTSEQAVTGALNARPDLILADIQLADGSQGTDAIARIRAQEDVPVIFITAFPERVLTGSAGEPTFIITKPFKPGHVKAVIAQALFVAAEQKD